MIPFLIKYWIDFTKSSSGILLSAHHFALFFIQSGISCSNPSISEGETEIIPISIRCSIPEINSSSDILSEDHHFALFFIQSGIFSEITVNDKVPRFWSS
jgi:hypothetical protein